MKYTVKTDTIKPLPPVKDGYQFVGWYSDKALTKKRTSIKKGSDRVFGYGQGDPLDELRAVTAMRS